jgi:hypothetical protein
VLEMMMICAKLQLVKTVHFLKLPRDQSLLIILLFRNELQKSSLILVMIWSLILSTRLFLVAKQELKTECCQLCVEGISRHLIRQKRF